MRKVYNVKLAALDNLKITIDTDENKLIVDGSKTKRIFVGKGELFCKRYYNFRLAVFSSFAPELYIRSTHKYGLSIYVGGRDLNRDSFRIVEDFEFYDQKASDYIKYLDKVLKNKIKLNKQIEIL